MTTDSPYKHPIKEKSTGVSQTQQLIQAYA